MKKLRGGIEIRVKVPEPAVFAVKPHCSVTFLRVINVRESTKSENLRKFILCLNLPYKYKIGIKCDFLKFS